MNTTHLRTEEIKAAIRKGEVANFGRGTGHTTALCEVIHEDHAGNAVVLHPNWDIANFFEHKYRELFPGDCVPTMAAACCVAALDTAIRGHDRPIYVDVLHLFPTTVRYLLDEWGKRIGKPIAGAW